MYGHIGNHTYSMESGMKENNVEKKHIDLEKELRKLKRENRKLKKCPVCENDNKHDAKKHRKLN